MPIVRVKPPHIQEAESFQGGLKTLYESMQRGKQPDEEIAAFYEAGKDIIRVYSIKMAADSLLILTGLDSAGRPAAVAGHFTSMNVIYRKIKLVGDEQKKRGLQSGFLRE